MNNKLINPFTLTGAVAIIASALVVGLLAVGYAINIKAEEREQVGRERLTALIKNEIAKVNDQLGAVKDELASGQTSIKSIGLKYPKEIISRHLGTAETDTAIREMVKKWVTDSWYAQTAALHIICEEEPTWLHKVMLPQVQSEICRMVTVRG